MTIASETTTPSRLRRAGSVLAAVVVAVGIWVVAGPLLGVNLTVGMNNGQPPMEIGLVAIVVTSLVASLVGWASLSALEHFTARAQPIWTAVAIVTLLVSFVGPLSSDAETTAKGVLVLIHVAVAAVLIPGLTRGIGSAAKS